LQTQVLIIGAGVTGAGLARDLALRGIACIIVEKQDVNAGASGANHGLLHSGARYIASDPAAAGECRSESAYIKKLAPQCIEDTGGLFVAVESDDETYIADFPEMCAQCGIETHAIDPKDALEMEPALSDNTIAAYHVSDASIDPFQLTLDNIAHARQLGARFLKNTQVVEFQRHQNRIHSVCLVDTHTDEKFTIQAEQVVNAGGAWAGEIASLAGIPLEMVYAKGTLLVTFERISKRIINRLRMPSDGDILVPGGTVSILGTTSVRISDLDDYGPTIEEVNQIISQAAAMLPQLENSRYVRAYAGIRSLVSPASMKNDRTISRGFALIDHATDGLQNFVTIAGGKLTTFRLMAEKTADLVCKGLGIKEPCRTKSIPLPASLEGQYARPGVSARKWVKNQNSKDLLLCECEMVPQSVINAVVRSLQNQNDHPSLKAICHRSRMGKGICQGGFCSIRTAAYLYSEAVFKEKHGIADIKAFLNARWKGQRPLMWGAPLVQAELQEAIHCGFLSLETAKDG
jgi:glycerol-3-phosphate dehydrogenase